MHFYSHRPCAGLSTVVSLTSAVHVAHQCLALEATSNKTTISASGDKDMHRYHVTRACASGHNVCDPYGHPCIFWPVCPGVPPSSILPKSGPMVLKLTVLEGKVIHRDCRYAVETLERYYCVCWGRNRLPQDQQIQCTFRTDADKAGNLHYGT